MEGTLFRDPASVKSAAAFQGCGKRAFMAVLCRTKVNNYVLHARIHV